MDAIVTGNTVAKAAVDIALHDIITKSLNIPAYKFLGGCYTKRIPIRYGGVGIDTPEAMAELSKKAVDVGFRGIKLKIGLDPRMDVKRVEAIRKAVGPDVILDVDVNGSYLVKEAIDVIKKIEEYAPLLVEQPVRREDLEGMALVRKNVSVPIGACESALTLPQIMRVIKMEAADFFNFKIDRSGGFWRGKQAVAMINAAGLFAIQAEQLGFGINLAAQAHFSVANCTLKMPAGIGAGVQMITGRMDTKNVEGDIVDKTPKIENGFIEVPEGPGLGVELVEKAVEPYLTPGRSRLVVGKIKK
jgi:L-alanine-DL-glutamate epimerase-like enolase superfamily enzyme